METLDSSPPELEPTDEMKVYARQHLIAHMRAAGMSNAEIEAHLLNVYQRNDDYYLMVTQFLAGVSDEIERSQILRRLFSPQPVTDKLRTALAANQHDIWAYWMKYLFSQSETQRDGSLIIPEYLVIRWKRQMGTPFTSLNNDEQASDLRQADKVIKVLVSQNILSE